MEQMLASWDVIAIQWEFERENRTIISHVPKLNRSTEQNKTLGSTEWYLALGLEDGIRHCTTLQVT